MTYIEIGNNTHQKWESVTLLHEASTDISLSNGHIFALDDSTSLHGSESFSVASGVVTLPSGSYYLLRGFVSAYYSSVPSMNAAQIEYRFYDEGASAYTGRRGFLSWQEAASSVSHPLTMGDEVAFTMIDASAASKTVSFRVVALAAAGGSYVADASAATYSVWNQAGYTRVEVWRFNA